MANVTKQELQPPFRQQDLLTLSAFIRYCKDRGVDTNERQLEYYEREKLLLPAVRVNHGYVEYRKVLMEYEGKLRWRFVFKEHLKRIKYEDVDKHTYYGYGGIGAIGDNWLGTYTRRGLVEYPAETKFREWKTYKGARPRKSRYFTEKPLSMYETFYSKYQIFPLKRIQDGLKIVVRDEALFVSDEEWLEIGKIRRMFVGAPELLQRRVLRHYETLRLLHQILDLIVERISKADRAYKRTFAKYEHSDWPEEAEVQASEEAWGSIHFQEETTIPPKAKRILKKCGLSPGEIERRREGFAYLGLVWTRCVVPPFAWRVPSRRLLRRLRASSGLPATAT